MKHKRKTFIIFWIITVIFLCSLPDCFKSSVGAGIVCLFIVGLFAFLGFRKYSQFNEVSTDNTVSVPKVDNEVSSATERRKAFLEEKMREFDSAVSNIPRFSPSISSEIVNRNAVSEMPKFHYTNITKKTRVDKLFPFVVVDTETTGLTPKGNDIIEVSAIRFENEFEPVSCFTTLLKPRKPISTEINAITHITDDMVSDKPDFSEIAESFSEYISGCNIVGHNLPFDLKFLFVGGVVLSEKVKYYDTLQLAKHTLDAKHSRKWDVDASEYVPVDDYDIENYKLETLCEYYGLYRSDAHRSLSDCYATGKVFENLIKDKMV